MANTYKNIVITPNRDTSANVVPEIRFSGGDAATNTDINLRVYTTQSGTLSFEGSAGQLFSITNDLTNTIFSVNDVSGIPSLEVNANGNITMAEFGGKVGIGTSTPNTKLMVYGTTGSTADFRITGQNISSFMSSFAFGDTDVVPVMELLKINGVDTARSNVRVGAPLGRINWYGARGNTGDALTYLTGQVEVVTTSAASGGAYPGGAMLFKTAEANNVVGAFERMRLDASGNLLIGRTDSTVGQGVKLDVNGAINASAVLVNGSPITGGAGGAYYQGNNGDVGSASGLGDIFRVHTNILNANVTIYSGNNALAAGPITINVGKTLTIQTNARVSIV